MCFGTSIFGTLAVANISSTLAITGVDEDYLGITPLFKNHPKISPMNELGNIAFDIGKLAVLVIPVTIGKSAMYGALWPITLWDVYYEFNRNGHKYKYVCFFYNTSQKYWRL